MFPCWLILYSPALTLYRRIIRPISATPAADPVVYLEGGPGGSGVASVADFTTGKTAYLRERSDLFVIDQRGTGYSQPALNCPEVLKAGNEDGDVSATHQACYDRFVTDGVNFADYNSKNNARDVNAVREALQMRKECTTRWYAQKNIHS